jgi:hypothetical protein
MAESLIDGIGSGYAAQVDNTNRLMVRTEGLSVGSVSVYNMVAGSIVYMPSVSVTAGSESYIKGGSISVYNLYAGSEAWIKAGSIQTYNPVGIGSVLITNQYLGSETWIKAGSVQTYNPVGIGSVLLTGVGSVVISGTVNTQLYTGSEAWINYKPNSYTGSVVVVEADRVGSKTLPTLQNTINWLSVKYLNQGSQYAFGISDAEGYMIQSLLPHTGNFSFLSPIQASGILVFNVSGIQASGTYGFRITYI